MFRRPILALAAVAALSGAFADSAAAQQQGGVKVNGLTAVTTVANGANNVGFLGDATQVIGGIHGNVETNGLTAVTTVANGANNVGFLGDACQTIGGITSGVGADC